MTETPRIYVGTYNAYNRGSLHGDWLDLTNYSSREEFYEACKELHSLEHDPEYMFQDYENIPEAFVSECSISEDFWDYLEKIEDFDEERLEALEDFIANDSSLTKDIDDLFEQFEDKYRGKYDSEKDFASQEADDLGWYRLLETHGISMSYFDDEAFARDLFIDGYWRSANGHVFSD